MSPLAGIQSSSRRALDGFFAGDRYALARLISLVEDGHPDSEAILDEVFSRSGKAHRIGVTGPPGAGKSTLVAGLVRRLRNLGARVGVVAVDPSSPFSHGALLGDRIRLKDLAGDPGLYIRSMATRGSLGGLARATRGVCDLLDAFGMERIVIETVGVGQSEMDVVAAADTVIVVLVPESGDDIQAMKAGLMEIGDVFVVNKADRDGADRLMMSIEEVLERRPPRDRWEPRVVRSVARDGVGLDGLVDAVEAHRAHLSDEGVLFEKRRESIRREIEERVLGHLGAAWLGEPSVAARIDQGVTRILARRESPYRLARTLAAELADGAPATRAAAGTALPGARQRT